MQQIKSKEQIDNLINNSDTSPVIFFKHSLTCPISARAYDKVSEALKQEVLSGNFVYMLIVQDQRDLSDYVVDKTGIMHESPQLIFIKNKQVVYHASHAEIDFDEIEKILKD